MIIATLHRDVRQLILWRGSIKKIQTRDDAAIISRKPMGFLGLFKFRDVTKSTLVIKNMTQEAFAEKLSSVTDQTTNIGFLPKGKKFHGLVSKNNFRLKEVKMLKRDVFIIQGKVKEENNKLMVKLEFIRGPVQTLLPTFLLILSIILLFHSLQMENLDWVYIPFFFLFLLIFLVSLEMIKKREIEKIKELILDVLKQK